MILSQRMLLYVVDVYVSCRCSNDRPDSTTLTNDFKQAPSNMLSPQVVDRLDIEHTLAHLVEHHQLSDDHASTRCTICNKAVIPSDALLTHTYCDLISHRHCLLTYLANRLDCPGCGIFLKPKCNHGGIPRGVELLQE